MSSFIPKYDVKIRGGKRIVIWRYGAHPTAHAASQAGIHRHEIPRTADQWRRRSSPSPPGRNSRRNTAAAVSRQQSGFSVLPPISSDGQRLEDNNFKLSELDDITLKNQCLRRLREMSERALQSLLAHLRAQDRDRDGVLSKGQTMVALEKYQLGLSEDATTNLCRKFGDTFDGAVVVRYEPLLSFLITMRMQALKAPPPPPQPPQPAPQSPPPPPQPPPPPHYALTQDDSSYSYVESIPMGYEEEEEEGEREEDEDDEEERHNEEEEEEQDVVIQPRPRLISLRNKVLFGDRDEAKLIIDLERQLADKPVTLSDLRVTLYELDHDRNDFVSGEQVETALKRCGVHLTPDVRARLLMATDPTGAGFYGIETLMSYIERVKPEAHCIMRGDPGPLRQARTGPLPGFQNQPRLQPPWPHSRPLQDTSRRRRWHR